MQASVILVVAVASLWASSVLASPLDLATRNNCMGCHATDKKLVGPSYKDISAKYKGKNVAADLVKKVKAGGSGVWGTMPMPPSPAAEGEVKQIVDWILTQ
jgi:cytochrome c